MKPFMLLLSVLYSVCVSAETLYFTSLSWPPYAGKSLPEQGASIAVAKAAFAAQGHELVVDFYPWSRTVKLAQQDSSKYLGYLPEYDFNTQDFLFSDEIGSGPLGLVQNAFNPIAFERVEDLKGKRIGVVQDYVNTAVLDGMIATGEVRGEAVPNDSLNIRKVAAQRIDAAVIDVNVLRHLLAVDPALAQLKDKVEMHATLLQDKKLYLAFKNTPEGEKWRAVFNAGLKRIDVNAVFKAHLLSPI